MGRRGISAPRAALVELGRVTVVQHGPMDGMMADPSREAYSVQSNNGVRTDHYELTTDAARFVVECVSDGRLTVRRENNKKSPDPSVEYLQIPDGPISLASATQPHGRCIRLRVYGIWRWPIPRSASNNYFRC